MHYFKQKTQIRFDFCIFLAINNILYYYNPHKMIIFYILVLLTLSMIALSLSIYYYESKLTWIEKILTKLFGKRTNMIASLYETVNKNVGRSEEVFKSALLLKKYTYRIKSNSLSQIYIAEKKIAHEIEFIFKVCDEIEDLTNSWKYNYVKDILTKNNLIINKKIAEYNKYTKVYNSMRLLKKLTIVWVFIPHQEKFEV